MTMCRSHGSCARSRLSTRFAIAQWAGAVRYWQNSSYKSRPDLEEWLFSEAVDSSSAAASSSLAPENTSTVDLVDDGSVAQRKTRFSSCRRPRYKADTSTLREVDCSGVRVEEIRQISRIHEGGVPGSVCPEAAELEVLEILELEVIELYDKLDCV